MHIRCSFYSCVSPKALSNHSYTFCLNYLLTLAFYRILLIEFCNVIFFRISLSPFIIFIPRNPSLACSTYQYFVLLNLQISFHILFICLSTAGGYCRHLYYLATMNNAVVNIHFLMSNESFDNLRFIFLETHQCFPCP